ncbi:MAG TPA: phosphatase PAP2 family protein, partial [Agromyces sp.]
MVEVTSSSGASAAQLTALGRRRPTGEPPPLPRRVDATTPVYVALVIAVAVLWVALLIPSGARAVTSFDDAILRAVARLRVDVVDSVMRALHALGSEWTFRIVAWPTLVALVVLRRFQRLVVLLGVTLTVVAVDAQMSALIGRMRPPNLDPLTPWVGYSHPSAPVAGLGLVTAGAIYTLLPAGPWRNIGAWVAIGAVAALAAARIYLAIDHPTDALAGAITGLAVPAIAFRLLTPDEVMPVSYTRGRRAHLQVSGRREAAIIAALRAQMGIDVVSVEPFALGGSAGSTPVRLQTRDDGSGGTVLFGKLYANVHLRSDRWFKLARAVMYGRLEDERSFNTVRRLVEYEDHMLRVARDAGLPTAEPYGFVEITPEREYLLVTEFLTEGEPLTTDVVDAAVIDDALRLVRVMWNSGLAHRDIKPGNLLVRDGRV